MPERLDGNVVIVGAGIAGLVAARALARAGVTVTVIEKQNVVGGLARSVTYGDFTFDIGPHRFHTDDPDMLDVITSALGDRYLEIPRRSAVWMFGKFHEWPLRPTSMLSMPPSVSLRALLDLVRRNHKHTPTPETFEGYIRRMYGDTLYHVFFEPYTRKFTHRAGAKLDALWAQMGIDRSLIDRRVKMHSLRDVARSLLLPSPIKTRFIYPSEGGIGVFSERLAREIESCGGSVVCGKTVDAIRMSKGKICSVAAGGEEYEATHVVWTGPITDLLSTLGLRRPRLDYLSLVCVNVEVAHPPRLPYQWCYVSDEKTSISRVSVPSLFNPALAPPGKHGLCAEVTCVPEAGVGDGVEERVVRELLSIGLIGSKSDVIGVHTLRVDEAYPMYEVGFQEERDASIAAAHGVPGLSVLGRTGTFWYNNMDHSIAAALDHARRLLPEGI